MGCNESTPKKTISFEFSQKDKLQKAIDNNTESSLRSILELKSVFSSNSQSFLDSTRISYKNVEIPPLAYSLVRGKTLAFSTLLSEGCSIGKMEQFFSENNTFPIDIIFSKNYEGLLDKYLPIYISRKAEMQMSSENSGLPFSTPYNINDSPVHIATRTGMLRMINKVKEYFENIGPLPEEFNLSSLNENGENCGLLACRYGIPLLLRHFHEVEELDLRILNRYGENAVMICLRGLEDFKNYRYIDCITYLVEVVGIDIMHRCEDMLSLAASNVDASKYLEKELEKRGVNLKASEMKERSIPNNAVTPKFSEMYTKLFLIDCRNSLDSVPSLEFMATKSVVRNPQALFNK